VGPIRNKGKRRRLAKAARKAARPERRIEHFKAARKLFEAIADTHKLPPIEQQMALAKLPAYESRGHGRGTPSRRYGNKPGKYAE
jgi:hypothetical protein